ncbi:MAG: cell division protein ZapA [Polyangiaceae bacterium]
MSRRTVVLTIGSREYKVVSSATPDELSRLAETVSTKLASIGQPGRLDPTHGLVLTALALAHDLEEEQARSRGIERRSRDMLRRVLMRLDSVLDVDDGASGAR